MGLALSKIHAWTFDRVLVRAGSLRMLWRFCLVRLMVRLRRRWLVRVRDASGCVRGLLLCAAGYRVRLFLQLYAISNPYRSRCLVLRAFSFC